MSEISAPLTLEDIMALLPGVSERAVRDEIRRIGCASRIGGKLYLELSDFRKLLKETKLCPDSRSNGEKGSHTSAEPLTVGAYEKALALATKKSQKVLAPKKRRVSKKRRSTAPTTKQRLLTLVSSTSKREASGAT